MLSISNLHVKPLNPHHSKNQKKDSPILNGVTLKIQSGQIHALMGPNGSGKTTLAQTLMGHPAYQITRGQIQLHRSSLLNKSPDQRARLGLFLAFQQPPAIPGVSVFQLLKNAYHHLYPQKTVSAFKFKTQLELLAQTLQLNPQFLFQSLNQDLSGGEKKKMELLQLLILKPQFIILDEIDTGLDVDTLKLVAKTLQKLLSRASPPAILLITHYHRILQHLQPTHVHVLKSGKIVKSAGPTLATHIERHGYQNL